jgi:hypothetical protein
MTGPTPSEIRFRVDPGDVPPEKAARRMHLTVKRFNEVLPKLMVRGFPASCSAAAIAQRQRAESCQQNGQIVGAVNSRASEVER